MCLAINKRAKVYTWARRANYSLGNTFYEHGIIERRRAHPSDDILGQLIVAEEAGDRLCNEELLQQSIGLLVAGLETTIGLINGMACFSH